MKLLFQQVMVIAIGALISLNAVAAGADGCGVLVTTQSQRSITLTSAQKHFLQNNYLQAKYHTPEAVRSVLEQASKKLIDTFGNTFIGIALVGGLSNGSFALRTLERESQPASLLSQLFRRRVATDADIYLLVKGANERHLQQMSDLISAELKAIALTLDGVLSGRDPKKALDLTKIESYLDDEDYSLLSLPFINVIGHHLEEAQNAVVNHVRSQSNAAGIWEQIKFYHDSRLNLYHGSFDQDFMDHVTAVWYPRKIELFGLPQLRVRPLQPAD